MFLPKSAESIIKSYYILLEFELAEICYKLNKGFMDFDQDEVDTFLIKYIVLLLSYLYSKIPKKQSAK